jgi:hypothetical protein
MACHVARYNMNNVTWHARTSIMTCGAPQRRTYDTMRLCWRSARKRRPCSARLAPPERNRGVTVASCVDHPPDLSRGAQSEQARAWELGKLCAVSDVSCLSHGALWLCPALARIVQARTEHTHTSSANAPCTTVRGLGQTGVASNLRSGLGARRLRARVCVLRCVRTSRALAAVRLFGDGRERVRRSVHRPVRHGGPVCRGPLA